MIIKKGKKASELLTCTNIIYLETSCFGQQSKQGERSHSKLARAYTYLKTGNINIE
jgi:hypothetical protein